MTSPLVALFTRSLREDTRAKSTYWARAGLATLVLVLLLINMAISRFQFGSTSAPGLQFFGSVISLQTICITLVGLSFFASAITEEKEEETLGLLRMTNLSPLSILLGKSTSRLCGALLLLGALFPFTLLAITLGGVSLAQILAGYCTLGAYTFLLCNLALLWSVIAKDTPRAVLFTLGSLVVILGVDGILMAGGMVTSITPIGRLSEILTTGFSGTPAGRQVWTDLALGVVCFFAAWAAFARLADRAADSAPARATRRSAPMVPAIRIRRPPRPWQDALAWKDFHFYSGGRRGLLVRVLGYGGLAVWVGVEMWNSAKGSGGMARITFFGGGGSLAAMAFGVEVALVASRVFRAELNAQTWSSLALLPLSVRQIARRKVLGGLVATVPAAVLWLFVTGLSMALSTEQSLPGFPGGAMGMRAWLAVSIVSSLVGTLFFCYAIAFVSLLIKRGALAVGFIAAYAAMIPIQVVLMMLLFTNSFLSGGSTSSFIMLATPMVTAVLHLLAIFFLHRAIFQRLENLAAEG